MGDEEPVEESSGSKVDNVSEEVNNRLSSLETKIELLLSLVNSVPGLNVSVEKKI